MHHSPSLCSPQGSGGAGSSVGSPGSVLRCLPQASNSSGHSSLCGESLPRPEVSLGRSDSSAFHLWKAATPWRVSFIPAPAPADWGPTLAADPLGLRINREGAMTPHQLPRPPNCGMCPNSCQHLPQTRQGALGYGPPLQRSLCLQSRHAVQTRKTRHSLESENTC